MVSVMKDRGVCGNPRRSITDNKIPLLSRCIIGACSVAELMAMD